MMVKPINIIFVSYNCGADIVQVLDDLKVGDYASKQLNIIIVDNASSDDSVQLMSQVRGLNINIIESHLNLGFGAGCNLAIPYLTASKTLLLNPDIRVMKDSLTNLLNFSDHNTNALIWGGKTVDPNGIEDGKNAWKEPTLAGIISWSFFGDNILKKMNFSTPDAYSTKELNNSELVDAISGCFFLIDTSLFKQLNGFDERFFMYSEEVDLCRRGRELGAKPMSTTSSYIIHEGSKTITSQNKLKFLHHSKLKYCKKHWQLASFILARWCIFTGSVIRFSIYTIMGIFKKTSAKEAAVWNEFIKQQFKWKF